MSKAKTDTKQFRTSEVRSYKVIKHNDIIQKARFDLTTQEQKVILYLISKIKPGDMNFEEHVFEITDFCRVCGLDEDSGGNYAYIKKTLKSLRDKSIWVTLPNGGETTLSWLRKVTIHKKSGSIAIRLDDDMKPYLLHLQSHFTQYELFYTLGMRSQYSIRLYELLKSYEYRRRTVLDIEELKKILSAEHYALFGDFKRRVLDISLNEINSLTDLQAEYQLTKNGRKYAKIEFIITFKKDVMERFRAQAKTNQRLLKTNS